MMCLEFWKEMPKQPNKRERIIMPPQFIPSPSEQKGFFWRQSPSFALFSCATLLLVLVGVVLAGVIGQINPTFALPVNSEIVFLFGLALWLFIGAALQSSDIQRGVALPSRTGFIAPPWLIALFGIIVLVVGIVRVLNLR